MEDEKKYIDKKRQREGGRETERGKVTLSTVVKTGRKTSEWNLLPRGRCPHYSHRCPRPVAAAVVPLAAHFSRTGANPPPPARYRPVPGLEHENVNRVPTLEVRK